MENSGLRKTAELLTCTSCEFQIFSTKFRKYSTRKKHGRQKEGAGMGLGPLLDFEI